MLPSPEIHKGRNLCEYVYIKGKSAVDINGRLVKGSKGGWAEMGHWNRRADRKLPHKFLKEKHNLCKDDVSWEHRLVHTPLSVLETFKQSSKK